MTGEGDRRSAPEEKSGARPLARVTTTVYWYVVTGALMIVAALPGALPVQFLESAPGNAPVLALCLAPLAPAFTAGLFALRDRERSDALTPARSFFRGYLLSWSDALRLAVPGLVFVAIGGLGAGVVGDGGALAGDGVSILAAVPAVYLGMLIVVGASLALWTMNAMFIAALFTFRVQDVARVALYYLFTKWRVMLGGLALVALGAAVLLLLGDIVFGVVAVLWTGAVLANHRALARDIEAHFAVPVGR